MKIFSKQNLIWLLSFVSHASIILYIDFSKEKTHKTKIKKNITYECSFTNAQTPIFKLRSSKKVEPYGESLLFIEKVLHKPSKSESKSSNLKTPDFSQPIVEKIVIPPKKNDYFTSDRLIPKASDKQKKISDKLVQKNKQKNKHEPKQKSDNLVPQNKQQTTTETSNRHTQQQSNIAKTHKKKSVIVPPKLKKKYDIPYPQAAKRMKLSGKTLLHVQILLNGKVGTTKILKSSRYEMLDHIAMESVRKWLFFPALKNNKPIISWIKVPIYFKLPRK